MLVEIVALTIDLHISLTDELGRFSRAAQLNSVLVRTKTDSDTLRQYVKDYSSVERSSHPFLAQYARERVLESADEMQQLDRGQMTIGPALVQLKGAEILRSLKQDGFATALGHLYDFWLLETKHEQNGRRKNAKMPAQAGPAATEDVPTDVDQAKRDYQQQSLDAVSVRRVPITRVFLLERRDVHLPADFVELIDDQRAAGVNVLVAYTDDLDAELHRDFAIWDNNLVAYVNWEHNVVPGKAGEPLLTSTVTGCTYHTSEAELLHARRLRERIERQAMPWPSVRGNHLGSDHGPLQRKPSE